MSDSYDKTYISTSQDNKVNVSTCNDAIEQKTQIDANLENLISNKAHSVDVHTKTQTTPVE